MKEIQTKCLHAGALRPRIAGAVITPIFQSSTFEYHGESYHDVGYLRLSNTPNHNVLARRLAALEESEAALITGSGMAAISAVFYSLLEPGDHLLVQNCLYGGTTGLLNNEIRRHGVTYTVLDVQAPETWEAALQRKTRAIYVETLSNPLVQLPDLEAVVAFARGNRLISIIDNTFASPVNFRPASLGGVESLIVRPAAAVHSGLTVEELASTGITDGLIRLSVGIEGTEDLLEDLRAALSDAAEE